MAIQLQCSSCQKVLQVADSAAGKKARCPGCQSMIDIPAASSPAASSPAASVAPVAKPKQVAEPVKTTASSSSIKVTCPSCGKVLQAPNSAAGKGVRCPGCQSVVKIPQGSVNASSSPSSVPVARPKSVAPSPAAAKASAPSSPAAPSPSSGNALWDALGDIPNTAPTSSGWETPATNPYANPASYGHSGSRRSSGGTSSNRTPYYIINGIIIALWGALLGVGSLIRIVSTILVLLNLPQNVQINYPVLIGGIIGTILGIIVAAIQVIGGIQMATRSNLSSARNAAVIAAIPCFGGCVFPFGIWATVLSYSKQSERDFGHD